MNPKNISKPSAIIAFLTLLFLSCSPKPKTTIEGEITNLENATIITLQVEEYKGSQAIAKMGVNPGRPLFKFKMGKITEPTLVYVIIGEKNTSQILLLMEPGERVKVSIDSKFPGAYTVQGSIGSEQVRLLTSRLGATKRTLDSLQHVLPRLQSMAARHACSTQYQAAIDSQRAFNARFIWANPMSRASVVALYQQFAPDRYVFDRPEDLQLFRVVASSLGALYPGSSYASGMKEDIMEMSRRVKSSHIQDLLQHAEATLPEIALPNGKGEVVRLSSQKGKVIVLNFWASWSQASLLNNRELSSLYHQLKGKHLEIFNVSLDDDRSAWQKAVETTSMPGIHVCECVTSNSIAARSYNVTEVPTLFVIDKNFDIIGKNVGAEALKRMILELL